MSLFGLLHDDAFLIFSRGQRHLYARVVVDLFRRFFSDTVTFPNRTEVVAAVYDVLRERPDLWHDGEDEEELSAAPDVRTRGRRLRRSPGAAGAGAQDEMLNRAWRVYNRLIDTGWLEEDAYGLRVTVDMPPAAMLLADRLAAIEGGLSASFRGVVSIIRGSLSSALSDLHSAEPETLAPGAAAGLHKAAEMAVGFSRELRMVLASLRTVERDILASDTLRARIGTFFQEFIGRLVLKDFESIYKTNHPYRYKDEILRAVDRLTDEGHLRRLMVDGYVTGEICAERDDAGSQLDADLFTLRMVFDNIDQTYDRINTFRIRLETRLDTTVKYAELGDQRHAARIGSMIGRLDAALDDATRLGVAVSAPEGMVMGDQAAWAPHLLREPPTPRRPITEDTVRRRTADPVLAQWRALLRGYNDMFMVRPEHVLRFLEGRVLPGEQAEARHLALRTVQDFLAFEQLRRYRHVAPKIFSRHFAIERCPKNSWRDDDWLRCENFIVRRLTDETTLLPEAAE